MTMRKSISNLIYFTVLFFVSSCATIITRTKYPVSINSNPPGADITVINKKGKQVFIGKSPTQVILKSGAGFFSKAVYKVKFSLPGYGDKIETINFKFNGWYIGNLLLGGVIGMLIIDPATGAMWTLPKADRNITAIMQSSNTIATPSLNIIDITDIPFEMRSALVNVR